MRVDVPAIARIAAGARLGTALACKHRPPFGNVLLPFTPRPPAAAEMLSTPSSKPGVGAQPWIALPFSGPAAGRRSTLFLDAENQPAADAVGFDEARSDLVSEPEHATGIAADQPLRIRVVLVIIAREHRHRHEPIGAVLQSDKHPE